MTKLSAPPNLYITQEDREFMDSVQRELHTIMCPGGIGHERTGLLRFYAAMGYMGTYYAGLTRLDPNEVCCTDLATAGIAGMDQVAEVWRRRN